MKKFVLIELPVVPGHLCGDFIRVLHHRNNTLSTDKNGGVRKHTESAAPSWGCEVAKLALCSEDVKTAALPPWEVPLTGSGCVKGCVSGKTGKFEQSQNTPLFLKGSVPNMGR